MWSIIGGLIATELDSSILMSKKYVHFNDPELFCYYACSTRSFFSVWHKNIFKLYWGIRGFIATVFKIYIKYIVLYNIYLSIYLFKHVWLHRIVPICVYVTGNQKIWICQYLQLSLTKQKSWIESKDCGSA